MVKNIFIMGEKGIGKSTLINKLIEEINLEISGFKTLPYEIEDQRMGFYLKGLVETSDFINNRPISIQDSEISCIPITETFETLGVEVLRKSLKDSHPVIVMDELGRLERMAEKFNQEVYKALDSHKMVIGVLQQASIPLLEAIKQREDTLVLTLTRHNAHNVHMKIKEEIERILNHV